MSLGNARVSLKLTVADYLKAIQCGGQGWVAEIDEGVVGFADVVNIRVLFGLPAHEGHSKRLHEAMVEWLWARDLERLRVTTGPDTQAERFYGAEG
ncbi:hypothetical protein [Paludisphaera mucosa]|uniref:N-acetyltransferase domain-containing protein n=1 Tax=Paludisphaera mucosa TaxID=3030827 RepID=A0ABT6FLU5_9BACT|nr:hypothetical protein [Paludisphaera mucosa]MDG3008456.1 hypothetical protein [Paludisphaera mucosa]